MGIRRATTETHAWCNVGQHMVTHAEFAKNQRTCRSCRAERYAQNNYNLGKTCIDCGARIVNHSRGRCRKCYGPALRGTPRKLGRSMTVKGYVMLSGQYEHPNANHRGLLLEHVKVMGELIGRSLVKGENVHHINGVRDDNRPENLELWSRSQPPGQRVVDRVAWAKEVLRLYEPGALLESTIWAA